MKISVIGVGYVGLVSGVMLAELGNEVLCADIDEKKISMLVRSQIPIYEPGLDVLIERNIKEKRLRFTTDVKKAIEESEVFFIAVGTPTSRDGQADLQFVEKVAEDIGKHMNGYKVIACKSTVPVGTNYKVKDIVKKYYKGEFDVVSNPEFLREGSAVEDCTHPDRVVIGCESERAKSIMQKLYEPLGCPLLITDIKSAEMIKYGSNSLLATEISFINDLSHLCEKVGADVKTVAEGMKLDKRIGKYAFLNAGTGFGGSCFPKDVRALIVTARQNGITLSILEEVVQINERQKNILYDRLAKIFNYDFKDKIVAVWGLAFKPNSDDIRESIALGIIHKLIEGRAKVKAFDPVAAKKAKEIVPDIEYTPDPYSTVVGADALLIVTEWPEFKELDLEKIKKSMKTPLVLDGRNVFDPKQMKHLGFQYYGIGR